MYDERTMGASENGGPSASTSHSGASLAFADLLLPQTLQVVFWLDMGILVELWNSVLKGSEEGTPCERMLAACVTLKYSMCLSVRLTQLLHTASAARLLVTDRAEQVQALLGRFSEVAAPLAPSVYLVLRQVAQNPTGIGNRLLEACLEVLIYANSYTGTAQQAELTSQLTHVITSLEQIQASAAGHGEPASSDGAPAEKSLLSIGKQQAAVLQSAIVSSMYSVLPELALKMAPEHLLRYAKLQLGWALQYDHMEERKCTLEGTRRVLLRIVRLRNVTAEWPWDLTPGDSLSTGSPSSGISLAPAAVPCPAAVPAAEGCTSPAPVTPHRDRAASAAGLHVSVDVGKTPSGCSTPSGATRQGILASIDSLINVGMPPKLKPGWSLGLQKSYFWAIVLLFLLTNFN